MLTTKSIEGSQHLWLPSVVLYHPHMRELRHRKIPTLGELIAVGLQTVCEYHISATKHRVIAHRLAQYHVVNLYCRLLVLHDTATIPNQSSLSKNYIHILTILPTPNYLHNNHSHFKQHYLNKLLLLSILHQ